MYNVDYQLVMMERRLSRAAGQRTYDETAALTARVGQLTAELTAAAAEHALLSGAVKSVTLHLGMRLRWKKPLVVWTHAFVSSRRCRLCLCIQCYCSHSAGWPQLRSLRACRSASTVRAGGDAEAGGCAAPPRRRHAARVRFCRPRSEGRHDGAGLWRH